MIVNIGVNALASLYRAIIQFALSLVLTRFVSPDQYAIIAMILPVSMLVLLVGDFGMTTAIVRAPEVSRAELGGVVKICTTLGLATVALTVLLVAAGAFAALPPVFPGIAIAFAVVVLLALSVIVPRAVFERRLHYARITGIETLGSTIGFVSACGAAALGAGVWSFAIFHLAVQGFRIVVMWTAQHGRVDLSGGWREAAPLMSFGGWLLAFNIVNYVARNADNYIVAGLLGAESLGIYALAYQVMMVPVQSLTWPISGVLMSTIARLRDDRETRIEAFLATVGLIAMLSLAGACFLALRAQLLFDVLLSPRWHAVGPIAARMVIAGGLQSITSFNGVLFVTQGRVRAQLLMGVLVTSATLATVALAAVLGGTLLAVANAYVGLTLAITGMYVVIIARMLEVSVARVLRPLAAAALPAIAGAIAMAALLACLPHAPGGPVELLISMAGFAIGSIGTIGLRRSAVTATFGILRATGRQTEALAVGA